MINGAISSLVIATRFTFPILIVMAALSLFGIAGSRGRRFPPFTPFALPLVPYLVLCFWGGANWSMEEHARSAGWRSIVLVALAIASLVFLAAIPVSYRRSQRWWLLIPTAVLGVALVGGAYFVGAMAISNKWI